VIDPILKYFPHLSALQKEKFTCLKSLYMEWNSKINVISRKDIDNFYIHHVLHSLAIARKFIFCEGSTIIDVGTGGGFPGIPLAIIFPHSKFTLLDSIEKKIKIVNAIRDELDLVNVTAIRSRIEDHNEKYNFVVSRAVTDFADFVTWTSKNVAGSSNDEIKNGIIYLKGGNLNEELAPFRNKVTVIDINEFFSEPFFETKRIVYLPV
jgi:16S rRNA (guanine527-N7)-methyltransferase